jgi:hypothetical protein
MTTLTKREKTIAISWILHAMKEVFGMEKIRKDIIKHTYPSVKNSRYIRTFDAFQQYEKQPYNDKQNEILDYCASIIGLKHYVVFTASNIQQDTDDFETHYQTFILDNSKHILYVINPSRDLKTENGYGIYEPEVAETVVRPFFEKHGYTVKYIDLTHPAQVNTDDVFCQTWSLYILLEIMQDGVHVVDIPKTQKGKYEVLLEFYKTCLSEVPSVAKELQHEYKMAIKENKDVIEEDGGIDMKNIKSIDVMEVVMNMTAKDMKA